jgi:hypothetical protein
MPKISACLRRFSVLLFMFLGALSVYGGLIPSEPGPNEPVAAPTSEVEFLPPANLAALPSQLTEYFDQVSVTGNSPLVADQFFVVFGDGSATSVRLLAQNFSARGVVLQPLTTLDNPWVLAAAPSPEMDDFGGEPATFDPALLLKVGAAANSLSGGRQYQLDAFTMADAPYFLGGGVAVVCGLVGLAKLLRSRRAGPAKTTRTTTRRRA